MTTSTTAASAPSASGARLTGDDLQHLVAWYWCLKAADPRAGITSVAVEAADAESVDDVVVRFADGRVRYHQVKAAVSARHLANVDWLVTPAKKGSKSLLQQLHLSWRRLGQPVNDLELITGRPLDPSDGVMKELDRRNQLGRALRRAKTGPVAAKRSDLAVHLECDESEVCDLFDALSIRVGQTEAEWLQRVDDVALGAGVLLGEDAALRAVAEIRDWVKTTRDPRDTTDITAMIDRLGLRVEAPRTLVVVQALGPSTAAQESQFSVDWIDRFRGSAPETRRGLRDPSQWNTTLKPELDQMARELKAAGQSRVVVAGEMRLPCWFAVGSSLREVAGFEVAAEYRGAVWPGDRGRHNGPAPAVLVDEKLGDGSDVALVVAVSTDGTADVREGFKDDPRVGRLVTIAPAGEPNGQALGGAEDAMATAVSCRDWVRRNLRCPGIHLVLIAPAPFALFLGHLWDRIAPTTIYEDLATDGYEPAFQIR